MNLRKVIGDAATQRDRTAAATRIQQALGVQSTRSPAWDIFDALDDRDWQLMPYSNRAQVIKDYVAAEVQFIYPT